MTHPFLEAVQAAYDAHGLPEGVASVYVSGPSQYRVTPHCSVTLASNISHNGTGPTFAVAYAEALAAKEREDKRRADTAARDAARKALADAGHDPDLIAA